MNIKKLILAFALADFVALNAYAIATSGLGGFFEFLQNAPPWGYVLMGDVAIGFTLLLAWMWSDSKKAGRSFAPYAALTVLTGSVGPLTYLLGESETSKR